MPDFTVHNYGTDTSGRPIYLTTYAHNTRTAALACLPFGDKVTLVQGAFMARVGGGAAASAGYHDQAGCWDERLWNLTVAEADELIRVYRSHGIACWRRDGEHGGMDPHIHCLLGTDSPLAGGAAIQWQQYLSGHDGLASNGPDYEWRPSPLVTTPPEDDMPYTEQQLRTIIAETVADELAKIGDTVKLDAPDGKAKWSLNTYLRSTWKKSKA